MGGNAVEKVGIYEAKTHFTRWIDKVAEGDSVVITRHGKPVAVLNSYDPVHKTDLTQVINELRRFRKGKSKGDLSIRQMIDEGRK